MTYPLTVDQATQATILDWFQYREVCDDEKFPTFFERTLRMSMRKYNQLLRIEPGQLLEFEDGVTRTVNYDWLIQNYREKLNHNVSNTDSAETTTSSNTVSHTINETDSKNTHMTGTDETDRDLSNSNTRTDNTTSETESSGTSSGTESADAKSLAKAAPQSASYVNGASGFPTTLDWTYPGQQSENKSDGTSSGTTHDETETHNTGTVSNSGSGSEDVDFSTERTTVETVGRQGSNSETGSGTGSKEGAIAVEGQSEEIENGRNIDIASLLTNAKNFILGTSAWQYLYGELDKCFIAIYD